MGHAAAFSSRISIHQLMVHMKLQPRAGLVQQDLVNSFLPLRVMRCCLEEPR